MLNQSRPVGRQHLREVRHVFATSAPEAAGSRIRKATSFVCMRTWSDMDLYHEGSRRLQDQCDTRRLADRIDERLSRTTFTADDRTFIEGRAFFPGHGRRGGLARLLLQGGPAGLRARAGRAHPGVPDYDGNGIFRSLGNLLVNPHVGLLFVDFARPNRLRVSGTATVPSTTPCWRRPPGRAAVVRVRAERVFPNCPRYIHRLERSRPRSTPRARTTCRPSRRGSARCFATCCAR